MIIPSLSVRSSLRHPWLAAGVLLLAQVLALLLPPELSVLSIAPAITLSVLFLSGIRLWPVAYGAALAGSLLAGASPAVLILMPIAATLQAAAGAYLLRITEIDPLFRRFRDVSFLLATIFVVSTIVPLFQQLVHILQNTGPVPSFGFAYVGSLFSLLILTPFLLRWCTKPRFSRTLTEACETGAVFVLLILIGFLLFINGTQTIGSVPLVYLFLVPFFWIALRLRPRFVTLALLSTALLALAGLFVGNLIPSPDAFAAVLYETEVFLITIGAIFLIVVSLEEDRRLHTNLMHSQVATLENAVARISSESKAKNDFVAVLAHELRNPLAPVVSAIELLKLRPGNDSEEAETLLMMEDRMHTVRRLLDDLLDISRISEGKVALKKEPVELEPVLRRAILSTAHHLKERHQSLTSTIPKHPLYVTGDAVRLEQIFSNLLTNASKYSDPGDPIGLSLLERNGMAEIRITDQGVGIEAEALEHIFTPFHQIELGARSRKGLGIGLALVRSFAEMHGGTVSVTSGGRGHGSQFTVVLPLLVSNQVLSPKKPLNHTSMSVPKQTRPSVLVVDDNDAAAWGIGKLLTLSGCDVSYAYDGRQATEQAVLLSPDIILLDLGLPDQDGYAVGKTLRARGFRGRLIALTGYSTDEARQKGKEAGFEHFLIKPAGLKDLKRAIPGIA